MSTPPDLRLLQANERTMLAWIRTGLALMAFGFVVAKVVPWLPSAEVPQRSTLSIWIGATFLVLGTLCNVVASVRHLRVRKAIIEGRTVVPGSAAALSLGIGIAVMGGVLVFYIVTR